MQGIDRLFENQSELNGKALAFFEELMELAAITSNKTVCFFCNIIKQPEFIGENNYHQQKTEIERSRLT